MTGSLILAGLGMAAIGFGGRYAMRAMPQLTKQAEQVMCNVSMVLNLISGILRP